MSLLVTRVLWNEVKVFSSDDQSSVHLSGHNGACENTSTDGNEAGERALLVCITMSANVRDCCDCPFFKACSPSLAQSMM